MAMYDYKCEACQHIQEEIHPISDEPVINCEKCGAVMKRALNNSVSFSMKKDGTIRRDYKNRYGGKSKKSDNVASPMESALARAREIEATKKMDELLGGHGDDPYGAFR
jgi:putative FmdB family regulatory protein